MEYFFACTFFVLYFFENAFFGFLCFWERNLSDPIVRVFEELFGVCTRALFYKFPEICSPQKLHVVVQKNHSLHRCVIWRLQVFLLLNFFHYSRSHFIYVSFIFISHLGFFQFIFWIFRLLESMNWDRFEVECLIMAFMSLLYENFRNSNIWSKSNWRFLIGLLWLWVNIRGLRKEIFKNRSFKSNFSALPAISTPYKSQKRIESNVYFNSRS